MEQQTIRVRIIKPELLPTQYQDLVGRTFEVFDNDNSDSYLLVDNITNGFGAIPKINCTILPDSKQVDGLEAMSLTEDEWIDIMKKYDILDRYKALKNLMITKFRPMIERKDEEISRLEKFNLEWTEENLALKAEVRRLKEIIDKLEDDLSDEKARPVY